MGIQSFDEFAPFNGRALWGEGSIGGNVTIISGQPTKCRADRLIFSNSDTVDHNVTIKLNLPGGTSPVGTVLVPAGAGYAGVAPVEAITALLGADADGIALSQSDSMIGEILEDPAADTDVQVVFLGGLL